MSDARSGTTGLTARIERSWQAGGPLQWALRPLGLLHLGLVTWRRALYRAGLLSSATAPVPVIVVGNRLVGGAGKTPTTLALVDALRQAGHRPGIVSRGHGAERRDPRAVLATSTAREVGDEPLLMQRRAGVPVWVGHDRLAVARALCAAHPEVDLLVCDDGLQHLRLRRTLEVVVFDERGAGNGWLLPAGPLREPITTASDVPQHVLYNATRPSTPLAGACARRSLAGLVALDGWWSGQAARADAVDALRQAQSHGSQVLHASAGIGQPERFFAGLRALGLRIEPVALPDHDDHATLPWPADARDVIVTEKDAVKLTPERLRRERPGLQVWVAPLRFELPTEFTDAVLADLRRAAAQPTSR
ncbi:tetraacyldisaccharide 4'-kinase [Leptothrix discophora]|uniref:Tetraacyldisaccharide 4'-kinase n=1 Tax=Leptothrix discophora TaxID=89 RepID=A0ABT9FYY1_LEPDI|nr:tetraacyldisaccharide 4'-kinase [Leptothrix discophora]MDP4299237.1 tetraacyldisaccharide 4'-kinase [Leptothrix discophora]